MATAKKKSTSGASKATKAASRSTVDGPSSPDASSNDPLVQKAAATQAVVASMPFNSNKPLEYRRETGYEPPQGLTVDAPANVTASTLSEANVSDKTGDPAVTDGYNGNDGSLPRVRVNAGAQALTTNMGMVIADNQNSLKAGLRGPTLMEDFILREKITHFDHERIPERIVHARGSGAHGFFEAYDAMTDVTKAAPFNKAGKITPVFVRFSTVLGERGATDTARDVRGFAVKFYTDEGNWDIVGNNIPVFFIQDAIKFPDLIHAGKPEPHHQMPQGASAHDTFWDFASLSPESTHMLMWVMSDRAIPRSYRMMQGFGVHTFRLINEAGASTYVKFHWTPVLGHAFAGVGRGGQDLGRRPRLPSSRPVGGHRVRQLSRMGAGLPAVQRGAGRIVLVRHPRLHQARPRGAGPDHAGRPHGVEPQPGQLLRRDRAGRVQHGERRPRHRLHERPAAHRSAPLVSRHADVPTRRPELPRTADQLAAGTGLQQPARRGHFRQSIPRGRVAYEPNSLGGGCPFQGGSMTGFKSFPEPVADDKIRGKPEKFADHYTQARLFFESQTPKEQAHIAAAFRFELTRVQVPAIRQRMLSGLVNVSADLVQQVADGLGMVVPEAMPMALPVLPTPEIEQSAALSLTARPGDGNIRTRKVAILIAQGAETTSIEAVQAALLEAGAVPILVGPRLGTYQGSLATIEASGTMETMPPVLFDALVLPDGEAAVTALMQIGNTMEFVKDQYRHCKTILALGTSTLLLDKAGIQATLPDGSVDPGLLIGDASSVDAFIAAIGLHRHPQRDMDPPLV